MKTSSMVAPKNVELPTRKRELNPVTTPSDEGPDSEKKARKEERPKEVSRPGQPRPCSYPECEFQWPMKRNWNPKRHYRAKHLPWFASVHLRCKDSNAFPGLSGLWAEFLKMLARLIIGEPNLYALLRYIQRHHIHPLLQAGIVASEDKRLIELLNQEIFNEQPDLISQSPPSCIAAIASTSVLILLLEKLSPDERTELVRFRVEDRQDLERKWEEINLLSNDERQFVEEFATVRVPETPSCRSVMETSSGLQVQVGHHSHVSISPVLKPTIGIIDSHFHYDRIIASKPGWSWSTSPKEVLDFNPTPEVTLKYAVTSFCDPERYPLSAELAHLKTDRRVLLTVGLHPKKVNHMNELRWRQLHELTSRSDIIGLGEVGLDYTARTSTPEEQRQALEELCNYP